MKIRQTKNKTSVVYKFSSPTIPIEVCQNDVNIPNTVHKYTVDSFYEDGTLSIIEFLKCFYIVVPHNRHS